MLLHNLRIAWKSLKRNRALSVLIVTASCKLGDSVDYGIRNDFRSARCSTSRC